MNIRNDPKIQYTRSERKSSETCFNKSVVTDHIATAMSLTGIVRRVRANVFDRKYILTKDSEKSKKLMSLTGIVRRVRANVFDRKYNQRLRKVKEADKISYSSHFINQDQRGEGWGLGWGGGGDAT